jgi:hypothetical protein
MMGECAWEEWFHCMGGTYGSWLRGDPRGWRERHHRQHVEGDYRNPPPREVSEPVFRRSLELMKRKAVRLDRRLRAIALVAIIESLREDGIDVLVASLDDHHLHLLGKFVDCNPRTKLGWAKLNATKKVKAFLADQKKAHGDAMGLGFPLNLRKGEGIWAKRSKAEPIRDRSHQINTCGYIADHGKRGAIVFIHPIVERVLLQKKRVRIKRTSQQR